MTSDIITDVTVCPAEPSGGAVPVQVGVDGQVGPTQRCGQSLPQTVLLLQEVLQVRAERLERLEPLSCRTDDENVTQRLFFVSAARAQQLTVSANL